MNRRRLLAMLGAVPILGAGVAKAEGDKVPGNPDMQALMEKVDGLQRQIDYKNQSNSPFQRSGDFAYGSVLDRQTGTLDVANTSAETTLYSFLMAPNTLYNNRSVRLQMYGDWLNNTGGPVNISFGVKLGTTTMVNTGILAVAFTSGVLRNYWSSIVLISADNSLAAQQVSMEFNAFRGAPAPDVGVGGNQLIGPSAGGYIGVAAEDTLQPLLITATVDWDTASANLSWRRQYAGLELL